MIRNGVALGVIALLAAACGSSSTTSSPSSSSTTSTGSSGSGASTASSFKACMVTDTGGINDKSFNQAIYQGILAAAASNPKVTTKYLLSTTTSDYASNITAFLNQKCGIIVTNGFLMGAATQTAAKANPSAKFSIVDFSYAPPLSNVDALVYNTVQDGFLGGYLAAGMTKTGKVATFGGQKLSTVTIYMDGFADGVQYYNQKHNKNVQVLGWNEKTQTGEFSNNFTDLALGQRIANTFITEGADIIFPVAGGVGVGAAKAVQLADQSGQNVNMMWVDTDGCVSLPQYCKYFITSVEKGISTSVKVAVLSTAAGRFVGGNYIGTLANGGVGLAPYHTFASKVPASLTAELAQIKTQIENGTIKPVTKSPV